MRIRPYVRPLLASAAILAVVEAVPAVAQRTVEAPWPTAEEQAGETGQREEQLAQFLDQLERARTALEGEAHGMGETALRNARALLDHLTTADNDMAGVRNLLLEAEDAAARGRYAEVESMITRVEEQVAQSLEAVAAETRPTPPDDPHAHVSIEREDVIGAEVVDLEGETIASVDDVVIPLDGSEPHALLALGGLVGFGQRTVAVPLSRLEAVEDDTLLLRDVTAEELKAMPEYAPAEEGTGG